jgi:signal transduction histidine kinase
MRPHRGSDYSCAQTGVSKASPAEFVAPAKDPLRPFRRNDASKAPRLSAAARERRRLARDLHDGVQNELVALIVELAAAEQDHDTPPALAAKLFTLGARAEATLAAIREIARGTTPSVLAASGFVEAISAQARRAAITVRLAGTAPRSSEAGEEAAYFVCLEALQNVAKHATREAQATIRVRHRNGRLTIRIEDDGGGFAQAPGRDGLGLTNIRDRIAAVSGTVSITSMPGRGTVVAAALPWPAKQAAPSTASTSPLSNRTSSRWDDAPTAIVTDDQVANYPRAS